MKRDLAKFRAWQARSKRLSPGTKGLERSKRMRKVSERQRSKEREWAGLKAQAIRERGDVCEACKVHYLQACSGRADDGHHMAGKLVQRLDVLLLVGRAHHDLIESRRTWAREMGFSVSRNSAA